MLICVVYYVCVKLLGDAIGCRNMAASCSCQKESWFQLFLLQPVVFFQTPTNWCKQMGTGLVTTEFEDLFFVCLFFLPSHRQILSECSRGCSINGIKGPKNKPYIMWKNPLNTCIVSWMTATLTSDQMYVCSCSYMWKMCTVNGNVIADVSCSPNLGP